MLDFRERLGTIATIKQNQKELPSKTLRKIELQNVGANFLENLLDYFATFSSKDILKERVIEVEVNKTHTWSTVVVRDAETEKWIKAENIGDVWEAEFVYNFIKEKFRVAEYPIKIGNSTLRSESFFVTIKP